MQMDDRSSRENVVALQQEVKQGPGPVIQRVTIGSLPDDVLLDIFDFHRAFASNSDLRWNWEELVHVCQRWRYIIFESPIRLDLQIFCTVDKPVKNLLDVWPPFPLVIAFEIDDDWVLYSDSESDDPEGIFDYDNLIAALELRDRVQEVMIDFLNPSNFLQLLWEQIVTAMQVPFPSLRALSLSTSEAPRDYALPDTFLNGSAPCLQDLILSEISFPSLPRLLSSTSNLISLFLSGIPPSGYIPPETMATSLSALPKLEYLVIDFRSEIPLYQRRDRTSPSPTRFVLPALTNFEFKGVSEYLEILAARFDAPLHEDFRITFFHQPVFDIPQTIRFFGHLESFRPSNLTLKFDQGFRGAGIFFSPESQTGPLDVPRSWQIMCNRLDLQVISVAQICSHILPFRTSVKSLSIKYLSIQQGEMDFVLWSQLFRSFTSVHRLVIPAVLETSIAAALQVPTGESAAVTEVFPSLDTLSIVGPMSDETAQQGIKSFVAARQNNGRPVTVSRSQQ